MKLWAIVPVKPFRQGKSRLAGMLTEEERVWFNVSLFDHTLQILRAAPGVDQVLVISQDPAALALAHGHGARSIPEGSHPGLNLALERATRAARLDGADSVLIVPVDLPLLTAESIRQMIARAASPPVMVIAPDRRGEGTNGLLLHPAGLVPYRYGPGSFQRHIHLAEQNGLHVEVEPDPAYALDLDLPEDLELLRQMGLFPIPKRQ